MAYSFYDASVVMAKAALKSLDRMLTVAKEHPNASSFCTASLIEDMKPLTFQVHYASFQAESLAAKVSGEKEYLEPKEDLDDFEKMHLRINQALQALDNTDKDTVNRLGETTSSFLRRDEEIQVPVKAVVGLMMMPNIYFHVSMAYAILRKEGVPLGKRDWSRAFVSDYV